MNDKKQLENKNINDKNINIIKINDKRSYNKNKIIEFDLSKNEFKEIITNKNINRIPINKTFNNIKTKFLFTSSKNYIYYNCSL